MALIPSKRLLVVAFILLCFISITVRARDLRETSVGVKKGQSSDVFKPNNHEGAQGSSGVGVDTMDYTPAKKNPPIHN
ncbi:hypothetical protein RIF29_42399 [Crotalaria pallida]|uniref:Uncharacterized protein n=1 Tax=Crotalaria pallida TaxID=3830 RepID=A0AAN9HSI9_CROPI